MATAVTTGPVADVLTMRRDELLAAAGEAYATCHRDADPALADARRHIAQHHDLLCEVLRRGRMAEPHELDFIERQAAMRARQGSSLTDVLEAFSAYRTIACDAVLDASAAADQAHAATRAVLTYVDLATTRACAAYLDAQQRLVADGERVRRDLLEDLLEVGRPRTAAGSSALRAAGLDQDTRFVLVAAVTLGAVDDAGALSRAACGAGCGRRGAGREAPRGDRARPPVRRR